MEDAADNIVQWFPLSFSAAASSTLRVTTGQGGHAQAPGLVAPDVYPSQGGHALYAFALRIGGEDWPVGVQPGLKDFF